MNARAFDADLLTLRRMLAVTRTITVVGLARKSYPASQVVAKYLIEHARLLGELECGVRASQR